MLEINHLLIIPDGNRRYANKKNIDLNVVYKYISDDITTKLIRYLIIEKKIREISFFAISRNNVLKRKDEDLRGIYEAQIEVYENWKKNSALADHIRFRVVGDFSILPKKYVQKAKELEERTKKNKNGQCNLLVAYDAQWELEEACKKISKEKDFETTDLYKYLQIKTPIDLIIRTGGEKRLSSAPVYQSNYAELFFLDEYYPELTAELMEKILFEYKKRNRRFGK